jgi:hypothetical protein
MDSRELYTSSSCDSLCHEPPIPDKMKNRTRTARLLLAGYLGFIVYIDLASGFAFRGVPNVPLGLTDSIPPSEVFIIALAIGIVSIGVFLVLSKEPMAKSLEALSTKPFPFWIRIIGPIPIAVLITLVTGELAAIGPGWGFPLPWKFWTGYCGYGDYLCPLIIYQPNQNLGWDYNWVFFVLDVAFYVAVEYCLLILYSKVRAKKTSGLGSS